MVGRNCVRTTALLSFSVTFPYLSVAAASHGMTVQVRPEQKRLVVGLVKRGSTTAVQRTHSVYS